MLPKSNSKLESLQLYLSQNYGIMDYALVYAKLAMDKFLRRGFGTDQKFLFACLNKISYSVRLRVRGHQCSLCSDGGIGRRSGLKIHRPQGCASSTLAPSTIESLPQLTVINLAKALVANTVGYCLRHKGSWPFSNLLIFSTTTLTIP